MMIRLATILIRMFFMNLSAHFIGSTRLLMPAPQIVIARYSRVNKGRIPSTLIIEKIQAGRSRLADAFKRPVLPIAARSESQNDRRASRAFIGRQTGDES